jgi:RNA polymerase sigma-70 factor (ECF subfamily)
MSSEVMNDRLGGEVLRWEEMTARLHPWIEQGYRLAAAYLGDWSSAEDVVQDAIVKSWQGYGGLRDQDKLGPWFLQIVVNECRRSSRRLRRLLLIATPDRTHPGPEGGVVLDQDLRRAMSKLNPDQRMVIVAHFYLDMTLVETAQVLKMPVGTVKSRLDRGLTRMRGLLAVEG